MYKSVSRILRCHPWFGHGGHDPVERKDEGINLDSKNVIAAIALSSAVIVLYSLFFIPEQSTTKQNLTEKNKIEQNTDTPTLDEKETLVQVSRDDALKRK